jgi:hypothetical protein
MSFDFLSDGEFETLMCVAVTQQGLDFTARVASRWQDLAATEELDREEIILLALAPEGIAATMDVLADFHAYAQSKDGLLEALLSTGKEGISKIPNKPGGQQP